MNVIFSSFNLLTDSAWRVACSACSFSGFNCFLISLITSFALFISFSPDSILLRALSFFNLNGSIPAASSIVILWSSGFEFNISAIWPCEIIVCCCFPIPTSLKNSWISSSLQFKPFIKYSDWPSLYSFLPIDISSVPLNLSASTSKLRLTSAKPFCDNFSVPAKITSSILFVLKVAGLWVPSTQEMASTTFDLPDPLGPTTTLTLFVKSMFVFSENDLKPLIFTAFKYIFTLLLI